jgi:hypothetical protein
LLYKDSAYVTGVQYGRVGAHRLPGGKNRIYTLRTTTGQTLGTSNGIGVKYYQSHWVILAGEGSQRHVFANAADFNEIDLRIGPGLRFINASPSAPKIRVRIGSAQGTLLMPSPLSFKQATSSYVQIADRPLILVVDENDNVLASLDLTQIELGVHNCIILFGSATDPTHPLTLHLERETMPT